MSHSLAIERASLLSRIASVEADMKRITAQPDEAQALEAAQARADSVAAYFGEKVSPPALGETALQYRRRLLRTYKQFSPKLSGSRFDSVDAASLDVLEETIYADAVEFAKQAPAKGGLREVKHRDAAGREITQYFGDIRAFIEPFSRRGIRGKFNPNAGS